MPATGTEACALASDFGGPTTPMISPGPIGPSSPMARHGYGDFRLQTGVNDPERSLRSIQDCPRALQSAAWDRYWAYLKSLLPGG